MLQPRESLISPSSPLFKTSSAFMVTSLERICVPCCTMRLAFLAASIKSRPSANVCDAGFST